MPTSLVLELQRLAQDSSTSIAELLRRAKVVATKLRMIDAIEWIDHEMSGYPAIEGLPKYRIIPSELRQKNRFRGWQPVLWEAANPIQEHFSQEYMTAPIAEIERLIANGNQGVLYTRLSQAEIEVLLSLGNESLLMTGEVGRVYPASAFVRIIEAVRTKILDFALELEQRGVLGEGMTFSETEKRGAMNFTLNVGSVGTLVHGDHAHAPSTSNSPGANVDQTSFTAGQAGAQGKHAIAASNRIEQSVNTMSNEDRIKATRELKRLRGALAKRVADAADAIAVGRVGEAEDAANRGDYDAMVRSLRSVGPSVDAQLSKLKLDWLRSKLQS